MLIKFKRILLNEFLMKFGEFYKLCGLVRKFHLRGCLFEVAQKKFLFVVNLSYRLKLLQSKLLQ